MREGSTSPASIFRAPKPNRLDARTASSVAMVRTPMPPICSAKKMTVLPKGDQWVAISTVVKPVTAMAEVAVKNASGIGVGWPSAEA